jgi:1-phosphofructokinase family hexose kinase
MITTVTLNPMLDKTVYVHGIVRGGITRATRTGMVVGGKGVNVSRQLQRLGMKSVATGFIGGEIGTILERLLDAEQLPHALIRIAGMTREGVTYRDDDGVLTGVFEPPHDVTTAEVDELVKRCETLGKESSWVACCGSSPARAADEAYARIIRSMRSLGVPAALDSYGTPLRSGLEAIPDLVKVNRHEWEQTFGEQLDSEKVLAGVLRAQIARGIGFAVLTDGERPCYLATGRGLWKAIPAAVHSVDPTGSGDSMLAGMLFGINEGWEPGRFFAFGVAAGSANARVWDVATSSRADIDALAAQVHCTQIS